MRQFVHYSARRRTPPHPPTSQAGFTPDDDGGTDELREKIRTVLEELDNPSARDAAREIERRRILTTAEARYCQYRGLMFCIGEVSRMRNAEGRRIFIVTTEKTDEGQRIIKPTMRVTYEQYELAIVDHLDDIEANVQVVGTDMEEVWQRFGRLSETLIARYEACGGVRREHWPPCA